MSITCHVTCETTKKILVANSVEDFVSQLKVTFAIESFAIQRYDTTFGDWVNIEPNEVSSGMKLNVEPKDGAAVESKPTMEHDDSDSDTGGAASGKKSASKPQNESTSEPEDDAGRTTCTVKKKVSLSRWPVPFRIPKFSPSVTQAIEENRGLKFYQKSSLIESLYDEMTKFTFRPSKDHYTEVISNLLALYPGMANGMVGQNAMNYWKNALSQKFRNERKRHEKDNEHAKPPAKLAKPTKSTSDPTETAKNRPANQWGVKHYLPKRPVGEDDTTIEKHIELMQVEDRKLRQDTTKIRMLMDLTFADRRDGIVNKLWKVENIMTTYPCLFDEDEILAEFHRLTEQDICRDQQKGIDKYSDAIIECARAQSVQKGTREQIFSAIGRAKSAEAKKRAAEVGAVLLIFHLLHENVELAFCPKAKVDEESIPSHIHIQYEGSFAAIVDETVKDYTQVAEGEEVCSTADFMKAVGILMATHYVFNFAYHPKLVGSLTFLQKIILNVFDTNTTPKKVLHLLYNINSKLK